MADTKTTNLTAIDAIADADLIYVVDDVAGTPTGKKATGTQVKTYINAMGKAIAAAIVFG